MRELKFRAWNESANRYSKPFGMHANVLNYTDDDGLGVIKSPTTEIIEQFTGLKDKNGKEIFEGDVVYCKFNLQNRTHTGSIVFKNGAYVVSNKPNEPMLHALVKQHIEVIGNIHENPELLTQ